MGPQRIIVIGASVGGFGALRRLFGALDPSLSAAVCVVLHTRSDGQHLNKALGKLSRLQVEMAADGPLNAGVIYVAPPDRHLVIDRNVMVLLDGPKENRSRPSIDVLFRSAAVAYRETVIGVVLTGLLDDGTAGLFYVKRHGGTTIVQDPKDAEFSSMPENALAHVSIDYTVPLDKMGSLLNRLASEPRRIRAREFSFLPRNTYNTIREEDETSATPSAYTCPDRDGPLLRIQDGSPVRFRCRVGHAFGLNSLTFAQSEHVEQRLWSALQSLKARAELEDALKFSAKTMGETDKMEALAKQSAYSRHAAAQIEKILLNLLNNEDASALE